MCMAKTACPTNYLAAHENFQICKFKLLRTEEELLKNFEVGTIADLETAMVRERSKTFPRFKELTSLYHRQHEEFAAADEVYELASTLQRSRIAQMQEHDNTIKTLDE
jgi:hypothetical protein